MKKKIISAVIAASLLASAAVAPSAGAKGWVNVSSWAYNYVSNFTDEGLIPAEFDSISDYRETITAAQLEQLMNAVLDKCRGNGVKMEGDANNQSPVTREYAVYRLYLMGEYLNLTLMDLGTVAGAGFADETAFENSYYAQLAGYLSVLGIMTPDENNNFNPKQTMTIEEAIIAIYRMYIKAGYGSGIDGAEVTASGGEVVLRSYNNGYYETKQGDFLHITDGTNRLMTFETDMYSTLDLYTNSNGTLVMARLFNGSTDAYNLSDGTLMLRVPYNVINCSDNYIFTADSSGTAFGVYGYDGVEILPPVYNINDLKGTGYYDITVTEPNAEGNYITDMEYYQHLRLEPLSSYVGAVQYMGLYDGDQSSSAGEATGIQSRFKNGVAMMTNLNGNTGLMLTWQALSDEAQAELDALGNAFDSGSMDDGEYWDKYDAISDNGENYSNLYQLTMTSVDRTFGDSWGAEGKFKLTKNGEIIFENAAGYLNNMPGNDKFIDVSSVSVEFEKDGKEYLLTSDLRFKNNTAETHKESGKYRHILEKSITAIEKNQGRIIESTLDSAAQDVTKKNAYIDNGDWTSLGYCTSDEKYGLAEGYVSFSDDIDIQIGDGEYDVSGGTVKGRFYVVRDDLMDLVTVDIISGTLSGLNGEPGEFMEFKSDDGRYYMKAEIAEPEPVEMLHGTREVSEFIDEEPYFVGTPAEQDQFDLEEHDQVYRRIVVDENGKVMFVAPINYQVYPDVCTQPGEPHFIESSWKELAKPGRMGTDLAGQGQETVEAQKQKILIWDTCMAEAYAIIPPEYQFAE